MGMSDFVAYCGHVVAVPSVGKKWYWIEALDKDGNLVCNGLTKNYFTATQVFQKLRENGYTVHIGEPY